MLPDGDRVARVAAETPSVDGPDAVVRACLDALARSRAAAPADLVERLAAVGVSAPGPVDPWRGVVVDPPNLGPRFRDVPLADAVETATRLPTFLDRDTNVAALAERAFGAARHCDDFLYLTVSTGIGGAIVSEGRLIHGPDGTAGELGHIPIEIDGPPCGCGGTGHLEAIASGAALARAARAAAHEGASPFLAGRAAERGFDALSARDVADGETAGDEACADLLDRARAAFAAACVGFADIFDPDRIVVGGSIAEGQGDRLLEPARDAVRRFAFRAARERVRILPAALGPDVSLAGAQPLVSSRLGDPTWRRGRVDQATAPVI